MPLHERVVGHTTCVPHSPPPARRPAALLFGFGMQLSPPHSPSVPGQHLGFLHAWSTPLRETVPRPEEAVLYVSIISGANDGVLKSRNTK